jgi:hypothetical protein
VDSTGSATEFVWMFLSNIVSTSPSACRVDPVSLGEFTDSLYGTGSIKVVVSKSRYRVV